MTNTTHTGPSGGSSFTTVLVHFALYILVGAGLIVANTVLTPASLWFHWPLLVWGAILAVHAWVAYRADLRRTVETYATEQRILTEMQLEKQAADIAAAIAAEEPPAEEPKKPTRARRKKTAKKPAKKPASKRASTSGKSAQTAKTPAKKKPARRTRAKRKPAASKS